MLPTMVLPTMVALYTHLYASNVLVMQLTTPSLDVGYKAY